MSDVSVIIPTLNRPDMLVQAIESVLAQSVSPREIIVVDSSPEGSAETVVNALGGQARYFRSPGSWPSAARNFGLTMAGGGFIGLLDDDDLWPVGKLEAQMDQLHEHPEIDFVLGHTQCMRKRTNERGEIRFSEYQEPARLFVFGAALFRYSAFRSIGVMDENLRHGEDDDWFMRAEQLGIPFLFLPEVSHYYRLHEGNMSHDRKARLMSLLRLSKNRIDVRRQLRESNGDNT